MARERGGEDREEFAVRTHKNHIKIACTMHIERWTLSKYCTICDAEREWVWARATKLVFSWIVESSAEFDGSSTTWRSMLTFNQKISMRNVQGARERLRIGNYPCERVVRVEKRRRREDPSQCWMTKCDNRDWMRCMRFETMRFAHISSCESTVLLCVVQCMQWAIIMRWEEIGFLLASADIAQDGSFWFYGFLLSSLSWPFSCRCRCLWRWW